VLDRNGLISFFSQLETQFVDKPLAPHKIHQMVSDHVKKHLPIKVVKLFENDCDSGWIYIGGAYYSDQDQEYRKCIELKLVFNPNDEKITYVKKRFDRMCVLLADTILHEIIHMRQYRRRNFKELPDYASTAEKTKQREEQEYYGCSDEIDAHAFNAACELLQKFKNDQNAVEQYLQGTFWNHRTRSGILKSYFKAFNWNHDHKIIKRLKSRIVRYLPNAALGKPYRNSDWIDH
jgi:hypothetical protein